MTNDVKNEILAHDYYIVVPMLFTFQKGAKVDKPMTDGRTAVIKAMENGDMPMIDILLAADKEQNFSFRNGFTYEMADLYQRDDRGLYSFSPV